MCSESGCKRISSMDYNQSMGHVHATFTWLVNVVCTSEDFKCVRKVDVSGFRQG